VIVWLITTCNLTGGSQIFSFHLHGILTQ